MYFKIIHQSGELIFVCRTKIASCKYPEEEKDKEKNVVLLKLKKVFDSINLYSSFDFITYKKDQQKK